MPERRWLTISQAAEFLQVHPKTAYAWAARGKLPSCRVGGIIRVDGKKLETDMERQLGRQETGRKEIK